LVKKYPGVNFYEPPNGQKLTGEYFRPVDTAENFYVSNEILKQNPRVSQI
jgi:hypothetical protein